MESRKRGLRGTKCLELLRERIAAAWGRGLLYHTSYLDMTEKSRGSEKNVKHLSIPLVKTPKFSAVIRLEIALTGPG
jgi:hypothetical protein